MGIDCSTKSLAFAILENGRPVRWGEIDIDGADVYDRLPDVRKKVTALSDEIKVDAIAFEKAIQVKSVDVAIKMAMVFGAALSVLVENGAIVTTVYPISWQSYIGNPNFTPKEKVDLEKTHPGRSKAWYLAATREIRKERTRKWVKKKYGLDIESNNVTDAFGLAYYCEHYLTTQ